MSTDIGIFLPMPGQGVHVADAARTAERLGLDSLWAGDHLMIGFGFHDATVALATAAAATERITVGTGVYLPALHELPWAAKQIGTLAHLVADRFRFGVGIGGMVGNGPSEWDAVGRAFSGRARRTDLFLEHLEPLLAGESVELDGATVALAPPVPKPPVWIGGTSDAALRRSARFGDGWLGALVRPTEVSAMVDRLGELAAAENRPRPTAGMVLHGGLIERPDAERVEQYVRGTAQGYGMDVDTVREATVFGSPREAADRMALLSEAGVELFAMVASTPWEQTAELLAETKSLLG